MVLLNGLVARSYLIYTYDMQLRISNKSFFFQSEDKVRIRQGFIDRILFKALVNQ